MTERYSHLAPNNKRDAVELLDLPVSWALIDRDKGPYDVRAITNITPDTRPQYQMSRSHHDTFRDPYPISRDHFLVKGQRQV